MKVSRNMLVLLSTAKEVRLNSLIPLRSLFCCAIPFFTLLDLEIVPDGDISRSAVDNLLSRAQTLFDQYLAQVAAAGFHADFFREKTTLHRVDSHDKVPAADLLLYQLDGYHGGIFT